MKTKIITSDVELRSVIPNQIPIVKGEVSLFDKLQSYIAATEQWVFTTFIPEALVDEILANDTLSTLRSSLSTIVACEALRRGVPSLDLILTPNGFATVGSQNLAVASSVRVDRLIARLVAERDNAIDYFLSVVPLALPVWLSTFHANFFTATLFPTLAVVDEVGVHENRFDKYLELRSQIIDIEESLAEEFFSPELMARLRLFNLAMFAKTDSSTAPQTSAEDPDEPSGDNRNMTATISTGPGQTLDLNIKLKVIGEYKSPVVAEGVKLSGLSEESTGRLVRIVNSIRSQVVGVLRGQTINTRRMIDTVNLIRQHPDDFPEWHRSETAKLFAPKVFTNQKEAKGYWF